jgi:hypothetical protein
LVKNTAKPYEIKFPHIARKAIHLTMVTTYGIKQNEYAGIIQNEVVMDDLF